ncbi:MAG: HIT domain-containing protein [Panacagrimonas sp.]
MSATTEFELHPRLAADTFVLSDLPLSRLLLMNDAQYPWCILVPRIPGAREIHELADVDQQQLLRESSMLGRALMAAFGGLKLNVAALGNMVPQLHVHHIVRFESDPAWPAPVWGRHPARPYDEAGRRAFIEHLRPHLTEVALTG